MCLAVLSTPVESVEGCIHDNGRLLAGLPFRLAHGPHLPCRRPPLPGGRRIGVCLKRRFFHSASPMVLTFRTDVRHFQVNRPGGNPGANGWFL